MHNILKYFVDFYSEAQLWCYDCSVTIKPHKAKLVAQLPYRCFLPLPKTAWHLISVQQIIF